MTPEDRTRDAARQELPAATRPTPPISKGGARAAIAARLVRLGYSPKQLHPTATDKLIEHAGGSDRKLRALLDTVLFLAASEGATLVDGKLVERALREGAGGRPPAAPMWRVPHHARRYAAVAVAGSALIVLGLLAWRGLERTPPDAGTVGATGQAQPAPAPSQSDPSRAPSITAEHSRSPVAATLPASGVVSDESKAGRSVQHMEIRGADQALPAARTPPVAALPSPQPIVQGALQPLSPAIEVDALALPPRAVAGRPPTVSILYVDGVGAARRLTSLTERLHQVGVGDVTTRAVAAVTPGQVISYFAPRDSRLAMRVMGVLQTEGWPGLSGQTLRPGLARRSAPRRGTIEVQLP